MLPSPDEPRVAHYLFAHRALPRTFLRQPPQIMGILGSDDGLRFLTGMWQVIEQEIEPEQRVDPTGLGLECFEIGTDAFAAVVTMPPPQRVFEAYFVALIARFEGDSFARSFSLDLAGAPGPAAATGILEWDDEGHHTFVREGGPPDRTRFIDAIAELVATSRG